MTVDLDARNQLAEVLRHLITGQITNDDFGDRYPDFEGNPVPAVRSIAQFGWSLYSDTHTYRLRDADGDGWSGRSSDDQSAIGSAGGIAD